MGQKTTNPWDDDYEFEDTTIEAVRILTGGGWEITFGGGWCFFIDGDSPVAPVPGMIFRKYGKEFGCVRGIFLDGTLVYYRTQAEDEEDREIQQYGKDAADVLDRWDRGESVWSVEMGGIGPSYEQAIQIAAFEILRHLIAQKYDVDTWEDEAAIKKVSKDAEAVFSVVAPLGLSGAQWGAAMNIAACFYRQGPRKALSLAGQDRRIQVSKNFPTLAQKEK